jgi:Glycosyl transferases group 1
MASAGQRHPGNDALDRLRARPAVVITREMPHTPGRVVILTQLLRENGFDVEQRDDGSLADLSPEHVVWFWGSVNWFPEATRSLLAAPAGRRPAVVLWFVEPLPLPRAAGRRWPPPTGRELAKIVLRDSRATDVYTNVWNLRRLRRHDLPDVLVASTGERAAFLAERGVDAVVAPMGYDEGDGRDLAVERDIDVLLLGTTTMRRRKSAVRHLRRNGVSVLTLGDYHDSAYFGESRTRLVNRAKIMLSIARFPGTLGGKRFVISMACKALVVSDPVYDPRPYVPGAHFVQGELDELPALIERYLSDDEARTEITERAYTFVTEELAMRDIVARVTATVASRLTWQS